MTIGEYLVLAFLSAFWPLLIAIVIVSLRTARPIRLLTAFLIGGLLTTITTGCLIVFFLSDASFLQGSKPSGDPPIYITVGVLAILTSVWLNRRQPREKKKEEQAGGGWTERAVSSVPLAFAAGIVLNILPGFFPIVALKNIAELSATNGEKAVLVAVFYVIMFAFVELPIVGQAVAPERTSTAVERFNEQLDRNGRRWGIRLLTLVGVYFVIRGVLLLLF